MKTRTLEWHLERRKYIGGSDCNIIMDGDDQAVNDLWLLKTGQKEPDDLSWVIPVQIGIATEDLNLTLAARELGDGECVLPGPVASLDEWPILRVELDGITADNIPVECKHVNAMSDLEAVRDKYAPQLHAQMMVTGSHFAYLSIIRGTTEHHLIRVAFDPFYADLLYSRCVEFWEYVKSNKPPRMIQLVDTKPDWGALVKRIDMQGNNEWASHANVWKANRNASKAFDAAAKEIKALMPDDAKEAFGYGIKASRSKSGAITIKEDGNG